VFSCIRAALATLEVWRSSVSQPVPPRDVLGARNLTRKRGAPPCCFLWVQPRAALESFGRSRVQSAADSLNQAGGPGGLNPWDFELHYHRAFDASASEVALEVARRWRDPCAAFQCEHAECSPKYIRYVGATSPPLVAGHSKKRVDAAMLQWENDVCGVAGDMTPERRALSRVRETVRLPCAVASRPSELCGQLPAGRRPEPQGSAGEGGGGGTVERRLDPSFRNLLPSYEAYLREGCASDATPAAAKQEEGEGGVGTLCELLGERGAAPPGGITTGRSVALPPLAFINQLTHTHTEVILGASHCTPGTPVRSAAAPSAAAPSRGAAG